jgi:LysM repeat protein
MAERAGTESSAKSGQQFHPIHIYNDNYYLQAREGDTFKSIGKEVEISYKDLAKYNERDKRDILQAGDIVYLKKKRKKADKVYKNHPHIVKEGDSMYSISQKYGIRLKSLYKKNSLTPDYQIRVGDTLRVY